MDEITYSIFLIPTDAEEKKKFSIFRNKDVAAQFTQVCFINASFSLGVGLICVLSPSSDNLKLGLLAFISILLYGLVWSLRKRLKNKVVFVIAGLFILGQILIGLTNEMLIETGPDHLYNQTRLVIKMTVDFCIFVLLQAPSINFIVFCYIPVFFINIIQVFARHL